MLLSKRKIKQIQQLFNVPYKPTLSNILTQNEKVPKINLEMKNNNYLFNTIETNAKNINYNSQIINERNKSVFQVHNNNNNSNIINNSHKYAYSTLNNDFNSYYHDYCYLNYYPLRREIIIKNPEEIIQSGIIKGSVRINPTPFTTQQNQEKQEKQNISQGLNNIKLPEEKKEIEIKEQNQIKLKEIASVEEKKEIKKDFEENALNSEDVEIYSIEENKKNKNEYSEESEETEKDKKNQDKVDDLKASVESNFNTSKDDSED